MSNEQKPREFWIEQTIIDERFINLKAHLTIENHGLEPRGKFIRVVEYEAVEKLQKEIESLKQELVKYKKEINHD